MAIHQNLALRKRNEKKQHNAKSLKVSANGKAYANGKVCANGKVHVNGNTYVNNVPNGAQTTQRNWEIPRKTLHTSIGFVVLYLYSIQADPIVIRNNLFLLFLFVCGCDALRFAVASVNEFYIKMVGFLMRKSEHYERVNGVVWYLAGCIGVLSIFPLDIAALSIVILSWCDTAASFVGRMYGDYTYRFQNGKSLAGTMGAIVVGMLAAAVFWGGLLNHDYNPTPSWRPESSSLPLPLLALLTGIIGGVSELIDVWDLDDNLVIPLAAGSMLWLGLTGLGLGSSGIVAA